MHAHISYPLLGPQVVLFMENRPFDHTFGCMELPGADYVKHGTPINGSNGTAMFTCGDAPYVCHGGTGFNLWSGKTEPDGNPNTYPYSKQSDEWAYQNGARGGTIQGFGKGPDGKGNRLPIKEAVAEHFAVFNKYFSSVPSASTPNHLFAQSATSCGIDDNIANNLGCGGPTATYPQKTIYDNLAGTLGNTSFAVFSNSTPHSADTNMQGVARYKDRFLGHDARRAARSNPELVAGGA